MKITAPEFGTRIVDAEPIEAWWIEASLMGDNIRARIHSWCRENTDPFYVLVFGAPDQIGFPEEVDAMLFYLNFA